MIEKLKELGNSAKGFLIWVVAPIVGVLLYIWHLKGKLTEQASTILLSRQERDLADLLERKANEEKKLKDAIDHFNDLKSKYDHDNGL